MSEANLKKSHHRDKETGGKRSPEWHKVEQAHLLKYPDCYACGSNKHVQVHHMKPFHLHPELELDPDNLISLCMDNDCHLYIGHGDDFKAYNPNVLEDAKLVAKNRHSLSKILLEVKDKAKKERLMS